MAARFIRIAGDHGVGGVGGVLAVDVRAGREDARPGQAVRHDHAPQLLELLLPLAGIAERGDAVAQLPQRQLRVPLDVKVRVDEAGDDRAAREVHDFGALGR